MNSSISASIKKSPIWRERNLIRPSQLIILCSLLLLGAFLFVPILNGYWLADDFSWVRYLLHYDWREIPRLFLGVWPRAGEYRPLWSVSFVMDLQIWGPDARAFHLTNIILHLIASALVWCLVRIIAQDNRLAAFLSLAFFVLHPIHVEPVAWISARGHILITIFILGSVIFLRRFERYGDNANYIISLAAAVAAFATQEAAAALPFLLLLQELVYIPSLDRQQLVRILKRQIPFWALLGLYLVFRIWLFGRVADRTISTIPQFLFYTYLPTRTLWLSPSTILNAPHALAGVGITWLVFLLIATLLLFPFVFLQVSELKNYIREFAYFAIAWPLITTLVYLGVDSERHLYLASVGPCVALGLATARLFAAKGPVRIYASVVATFLSFTYAWALVAGVAGFALNGQRSLQIQHEVDRAIGRASQDPHAIVIVIPEIPHNQEVLWDYFYPDALLPPFTQHSPSIPVIPSFASCHCRPAEWMAANRASIPYLTHDGTEPIYVVQWDTLSEAFTTYRLSREEFKNEGYLASTGSFLGPPRFGEAVMLP